MPQTQLQAPPHGPPRGGAGGAARTACRPRYCALVNTQHLSVSVTLYPDGEWAIALLRTTTEPGRPARSEQLITRKTDLEHVRRDVAVALQRMVESEHIRMSIERAERENTPDPAPRRARR